MRGVGAGDVTAVEELDSIETVGPVIVEEIREWFSNPRNLTVVNDLLGEISIRMYERPEVNSSPIAGKTVVFTGTLERMDRQQAEAHAISLGAKASGSVSGRTSYLVYGPNAGSKFDKAKQLKEGGANIEIMTEDEWFAFLGLNADNPARTAGS
jgi:DNA ligase (NAD+)